MRLLNRNKQSIYYATYVSKTANKDEYGNETGEYTIKYSTPVKVAWNISYVDSDAEVAMFGIESKDVLRIVAEKVGFPLDEASILWFGKDPHTPYADTAPDHNYVVAGIRPSLNELVFYARKIDTFAPQPVIPEEPIDPEEGE